MTNNATIIDFSRISTVADATAALRTITDAHLKGTRDQIVLKPRTPSPSRANSSLSAALKRMRHITGARMEQNETGYRNDILNVGNGRYDEVVSYKRASGSVAKLPSLGTADTPRRDCSQMKTPKAQEACRKLQGATDNANNKNEDTLIAAENDAIDLMVEFEDEGEWIFETIITFLDDNILAPAMAVVSQVTNWIANTFNDIINWIAGVAKDVVGFFGNIVSEIGSLFG